MSNLPYTGNDRLAFKLIVMKDRKNANLVQWYIPYDSNPSWVGSKIAYRTTDDGGTNWSSWLYFATIDKVHFLEEIAPDHRISSNQDLNSFTQSGTWQCNHADIAVTLSNCPVSVSFKLVVDRKYGRSASEITQRITCQNATETVDWFRTKSYNSSTWGLWVHLPYIEDRTWGSNTGFQSSFIGTNGKKGVLHYNHVANHLVHNFYNGSTWDGEKTLANLDDISPSEIGLGYAQSTISGSAITATITGFKLRAGVIVSIKINNEMSTACTLNINNTGAKNIKFWGDENPSFGKFIGGGNIVTFIYDGTYYRVISQDRTPKIGVQSYVADTSGSVLLDWGYDVNRAQLKYAIGLDKLRWNYYKNSTWRGDLTVADYDDIVHQTLGVAIPDNADLNNYTTNGIYNISSNARAATISNMPSPTAGKLIVMRVTNDKYVNQYFLPFFGFDGAYGQKISRRAYDASKPYWTDWTTITEQTAPLSGNVKILLKTETTTAQNRFVGLTAAIKDTTTGKTFSYDVLKAYQDHQAEPVGLDLVVEGGGNTFICGGDGGTALYALKKGDGSEQLYLLSDNSLHLEGNAQTIANRQGFKLTSGGALLPEKAETVTDNFGDIGESTHKLANLWVYKINGSTPITADNVIVSNQNIGSSSAIDSLDDIPLNTAGRVNITASLSPCGLAGNYTYIYYGISNANRVIELTRTNHGSKNTEEKWYQANNGTSWTGWMPLSRQGTYVGTCATAANERAKVATVDADFSLKKGVRVAIKFSNTNTYSSSTSNPVTLNVNGTGAKNIWYNNTHSGAGNTGTYNTVYGYANRYCYYIYDGTYWVWDSHGADNNSTGYLPNNATATLTTTANNAYIILKSSDIDSTQSNNGVSEDKFPAVYMVDKNGGNIGRFEAVVKTNGDTGARIYSKGYKSDGTTTLTNGFTCWQNKSGDRWYTYTDVANAAAAAGGTQYCTCSTAADQQVKVVTPTHTRWQLRVGAIIAVKFTNTNSYSSTTSAPCQLNVNGTGAKNIWYWSTHSGAGNTGTNTTIYGVANRFTMYMYDCTYWVWIGQSGEADTVDPRNLGFGYGTCDTAESTTAKVVTLGSYTLRTGGYVTVKFTNGVPINATMNINSKGAKNIWYRGANIVNNTILAGDLATFIYDGTRYHLIGIDRNSTAQKNIVNRSNVIWSSVLGTNYNTDSWYCTVHRSGNIVIGEFEIATNQGSNSITFPSYSMGTSDVLVRFPNLDLQSYVECIVDIGEVLYPAFISSSVYDGTRMSIIALRKAATITKNTNIRVSFFCYSEAVRVV